MNWTDIEADLKTRLTPKRFRHTMNVVEAAEKLACTFGCDPDQARLAGGDRGTPIVETHPEHPAAAAITELAASVADSKRGLLGQRLPLHT